MTNSSISKTYPKTGLGHQGRTPERRMRSFGSQIIDMVFTMGFNLDDPGEKQIVDKLHEAATLANEMADGEREKYDSND